MYSATVSDEPGVALSGALLSEVVRELLGASAVVAAVPASAVPARYRVPALVDHRVEHASLLGHVRHLSLLIIGVR